MEVLSCWLAEIFSGISVVLLLVVLWKVSAERGADLGAVVREEIRFSRSESEQAARRLREEVSGAQKTANEMMVKTINETGKSQLESLGAVEKRIKLIADANEIRFDKLRETVDRQLRLLQKNNEIKLEQMRQTVDEKLQSTLEKRLGESFKLVSERLEAVQRGLGDMQSLASGVGDLKRMLTNVKARGTWGEFQLGDILEQILTPDQFSRNVQPKADSGAIVEYAVRLPGTDDVSSIWLPIDAKFPQEDYLRLLDAAEIADFEAVEKSTAALIRTIQSSAKEIAGKYIDPPQTTDFALMFLPTEGLYSEVLRQPGMVENLQQQYRVVVAGPTTLAAILNSLRMGFRTLAIEKRSSEVWTVLSAVKTEFGKFGEVLAKVKKQLETASNTIEMTGARTRAMEKKLRDVEELPTVESSKLLGFETVGSNFEDDTSEESPIVG
ncbi:MAG: DNA recombination protein RmuC [Pseudomonadota bacterium]|nr:DNA recombination protein RmuC [Pseudomonadota bacterium]